MPSPHPEPSALQELKGNTSSRLQMKKGKEELLSEPKPVAAGTEVPEELEGDGYAVGEWSRLAPELARLGLLTVADTMALIAYCAAYSQWRSLRDGWSPAMVADETARGTRTISPETKAMLELYRTMLQYMDRLGLSPSARVKLRTSTPPTVDPKPANAYFQ